MPFYPSPGRDDGYDISDYGDINPAFGNMKDFRRFMQEAKKRDLRVITELVVNHTSDQHDWFKRAKRSPKGSSARDWYVWSDTDQKYQGTRIIFTDTEKSNWTWDAEANAFYWHRFFSHQPDLNFDNPRVVSAVLQVHEALARRRRRRFPVSTPCPTSANARAPTTRICRKRMWCSSACAPNSMPMRRTRFCSPRPTSGPEDVQQYFGNGDECHMPTTSR
ncbi:MAG: alpha-amylase family glycosyl hydrolase [Pseudolabrys sp.]